MAFRPSAVLPDFSRLKSVFVGGKDQIKDYLVFQTIVQLLDFNQKIRDIFSSNINDLISDTTEIKNAEVATVADESDIFPNSRELLAGTGVTFDDTVANQRTINTAGSGVLPVAVGDGTGMMVGDSWLVIPFNL